MGVKIKDIEIITKFNISKNHTKKWGCIYGNISRSYLFMSEDKNKVLEWILNNYKKYDL